MAEKNNNPGMLNKLKTVLDRMLGRKEACPLDVSYRPKQDTPCARRAYRIDVDNMHVICRNPRVKCRISDISATGIGFISSKEFPVGETLEAVVLWSGKPVLKKLKMKIMRHQDKIVGCEFQDMDRTQDKIISKIVLAAQKRLIQKKHCGKTPCKPDEEIKSEVARASKVGPRKKQGKKIKL